MTVVLIILNLISIGIAYYLYIIMKQLAKFLREQRAEDELRVMNGDKEDETSYEEYINSGIKYDCEPKTNEYERDEM